MRDTSSAVSAIAERRDDLAGLVTNTNTAFRAIGDESASLDRALELLPSTLRKANTTFVNLRSTLDDLQLLVDESKPATKDLARFLSELRPLVREARPTVADLRTLIRKPGSDNDLIELTAKQPRLAQLTASVFPRAIRTLDDAQPVFEYFRGYTPDFTSWISSFGQVAANYDANGHYARVQPMFLPANYAGGTLTATDPSQKLNGFERNVKNRCPGGVIQAAPDGSSPLDDQQLQPGGDPVRRLIWIGLFVAIVPWIVIGIVREATDNDTLEHYYVRAIFDNAANLVEGEDVKVAGVPVGVVNEPRGHGRQEGRRHAAHRRRGLHPLEERRQLRDPPPGPDRREVRGVQAGHDLGQAARADPERRRRGRAAAAGGQHQLAGRHRPAQRHPAAALPGALRDPAERVRHRPGRPRRRPQRGHPPRQPGAARDRQAARGPRQAEPHARQPRARLRRRARPAGARAQARVGLDRPGQRHRRGLGRAARRHQPRHRAACPSSCASCGR